MDICAISDLHGHLPELPESDLLLIAGNIFPQNIANNPKASMDWFKDKFIEWCKEQETWEIVLIAGTRDWVLQQQHDKFKESIKEYEEWFHYLRNEYTELDIKGEPVSIFGTPFTRETGHWAFMKNDKELERLFNACPNQVDILLTHDAAYGVSDIPFERLAFMKPYEDINQGSKPLRDVYNRTTFKYGFHGNIRSSNRNLTNFKNAKVCNVSYVDEKFNPVVDFKPTLVTMV